MAALLDAAAAFFLFSAAFARRAAAACATVGPPGARDGCGCAAARSSNLSAVCSIHDDDGFTLGCHLCPGHGACVLGGMAAAALRACAPVLRPRTRGENKKNVWEGPVRLRAQPVG